MHEHLELLLIPVVDVVPGERDQTAQRLPAGGRQLVGVRGVLGSAVADDDVPVGGGATDVTDRRVV
jgi:hypothetical protein